MFLPHINFQWTALLFVFEIVHCVAENSVAQYQARNTDVKKKNLINIHVFCTGSGQLYLPLGCL